jgi:hypothetical protein
LSSGGEGPSALYFMPLCLYASMPLLYAFMPFQNKCRPG